MYLDMEQDAYIACLADKCHVTVRCSAQSIVPGILGIATNIDLSGSASLADGHSPVCKILLHSLQCALSTFANLCQGFDFLSLVVPQIG